MDSRHEQDVDDYIVETIEGELNVTVTPLDFIFELEKEKNA